MSKKSLLTRAGVVLVIVAVVVAVTYLLLPGAKKNTVVAYFTSTTGIYSGDDVKVLGVKVGTIDSITPQGDRTKVTFSFDADQPVPADAKALIVSESLVSSRFIQLAPVSNGGPKMADNAVIDEKRTAVPVEWDQIKDQLGKLATALGPQGANKDGALGDVVNSAAAALDGNGQTLHDTLTQLSQAIKTLSDGRVDLFSTIRNLQVFVSALSASNTQLVEFGGRLASVSDVLAKQSTNVGTALQSLDVAVVEVERFVRENRDGLRTSVQGLAQVTQVLADKRPQLEQVLHSAPTALANFFNIYQPANNALTASLAISNFQNPINFICGAIAGIGDAGAEQGAKLCAQYLGPFLNTLKFNYPALGFNPVTGVKGLEGQTQLSEPGLDPYTGIKPGADKPGSAG
ncbi:MAG: MCE family protein, partial [Mycobacteriaceae bacterium]